MRSLLSFSYIFLSSLLLHIVLASALRGPLDSKHDSLAKRDSVLDRLKDIKPVNERAKSAATNKLTAQAKKESRTKVAPKSVSGAKVVDFIKTGTMPASGAKFATLDTSTEANNAQLSDGSKDEAMKTSKVDESCKTTDNRKPWGQASPAERQAWLTAVKCTYDQPGRFKYKDIVSDSLADDFGLIHAILNPYLHHNPAFLVCHRALILNWLDELRNKCGYKGDSLYLDLNSYADAGKLFTDQDLWGSDALGSLTCPAKGKYVDDLTFQYIGNHGQSVAIYNYKHPLCRSKQERWEGEDMTFEDYQKSEVIKELWQLEGYDNFRSTLEVKLHNAFHAAIRRDMYASTSPFDAFLFFGFHLQVDCVYWGWQENNGGKNRLLYDGLHKGTNDPVSVNDMCPMLSLGTNWTVADVLDSREDPGCFTCQAFKPSPF